MIKQCEICGRSFFAKRADARYCSSTCRVHKHRGYEMGPVPAVKPTYRMGVDDVNDVVMRAKGVVSDLSVASLCTDGPLSEKLGRAASGLRTLLDREGLL